MYWIRIFFMLKWWVGEHDGWTILGGGVMWGILEYVGARIAEVRGCVLGMIGQGCLMGGVVYFGGGGEGRRGARGCGGGLMECEG